MEKSVVWQIKQFNELSLQELYSLLKLRSHVFIVEQNCVYQDVDGKDEIAMHLLGKVADEIVAYSRLFKAGDYFENASFGRVVIHPKFRDNKWGHDMMQQAIAAIEDNFHTKQITISAQLYLKKFYESNGFTQTSDTYLEDDIPHIEMKYGI